MRKLPVFLMLFLIPFVLKSQDYFLLYSEYLPEIFQKDHVKQKLVTQKITYYAKLNPDLIYFYINYLDAYYNKSIKDKKENGLQYLDYLENISIIRWYEWIEFEIKYIKNLGINKNLSNELLSFYHPFMKNKPSQINNETYNFSVDKNLQYFYSYKFYINKNIEYDKSKNYEKLKLEYEKKILEELDGKYTNRDYLTNYEEEIYNILRMWNIIYVDDKPSLYTSKYLLEILQSNFQVRENKHFTINIGFLLFSNINNATIKLERPKGEIRLFDELPYSKQLELAIGLNYKHYIREYYDLFAYIKLELRFSKYILGQEFDIDYFHRTFSYNTGGQTYAYNLEKLQIKDYSSSTFMAKLSTPIYYINENLYFGLGLTVIHSDVNFNTKYRFKVVRNGTQIAYTSYYEDSIESKMLSFLPGINVNYYLSENHTTSLEIYYNSELMIYLMFGYYF